MTDKTALHKAVTAVMAEVHSLKKDEKNDHGKYNYVSVDSFKNLVRPLMAKHGLSLSMTEVEFGLETLQNRNGPSVNAKITYQFTLRHESGAEDDPERTTIILPLTGAQTAGAAKSYAIKEYLKGRFLVSTGDKDLIVGGADADAYAPQEFTGKERITPHDDGPRPTEMPSVNGTEGASKAAFREPFDAMTKAIRNAPNKRELKSIWTANAADIDEWPPDFVDLIKLEYLDRKKELEKVLA
jgi:hypothetical protein